MRCKECGRVFVPKVESWLEDCIGCCYDCTVGVFTHEERIDLRGAYKGEQVEISSSAKTALRNRLANDASISSIKL